MEEIHIFPRLTENNQDTTMPRPRVEMETIIVEDVAMNNGDNMESEIDDWKLARVNLENIMQACRKKDF